jgi:hypothetical protein
MFFLIFISKGDTIMAYRAYVWRKENPERRTEQKKREKVRARLRKLGVLPPVGEEMNDYQKKLNEEISNNDYTTWEEIRVRVGVDYANPQPKRPKKTPQHLLWYRAKSNAKDNKYDFNLEIEDIIIPEKCPYLNIDLVTDFELRRSPNYFSIDRIDSTKGYVKGNVQVISMLANTMKNNANNEQLRIFAENVLKLHK